MPKNYFQHGSHPPSWVCENCRFGHVTSICMWFFISVPNIALIGQYGAEIWPKTIFNMVPVRHLEFEKFRFFCLLAVYWNYLATHSDYYLIHKTWDMKYVNRNRVIFCLNSNAVDFSGIILSLDFRHCGPNSLEFCAWQFAWSSCWAWSVSMWLENASVWVTLRLV